MLQKSSLVSVLGRGAPSVFDVGDCIYGGG